MRLDTYIAQHTTVTDFARRIGRSRSQVHRYMRGENLTLSIIEEIHRETGGEVGFADLMPIAPLPTPTEREAS